MLWFVLNQEKKNSFHCTIVMLSLLASEILRCDTCTLKVKLLISYCKFSLFWNTVSTRGTVLRIYCHQRTSIACFRHESRKNSWTAFTLRLELVMCLHHAGISLYLVISDFIKWKPSLVMIVCCMLIIWQNICTVQAANI